MERWKDDEMLIKAAEYFKKAGFLRLFTGLKERYGALSRLGGRICLNGITKEEAEALEGFLQIRVTEGSRLILSVEQVRKALKHTRYGTCVLEELVPLVLDKSLVSDKEEKIKRELEMEAFFQAVETSCKGTPAGTWFETCLAKEGPFYTVLKKDYHEEKQWLEENLPLVFLALNQLPVFSDQYMGLPVFAAFITGNPHYFDEGKKGLKYLVYGIRHLLGIRKPEEHTIEARAELLYQAGILKDDLYNWVLCYGVHGYVSPGKLHEGMEEYLKRGESQILTLKNLTALQSADTDGKRVYVVENPSIFAWLTERKGKDCACICSGGQLRLSVLVLLDLLVKEGVAIYYSGDFDPEGLSIAQKLVSRYEKQLKLWCYQPELYSRAMSLEGISDKRLKQLDRLTDETLVELGGLLKKYRHPGYQENIMNSFLE